MLHYYSLFQSTIYKIKEVPNKGKQISRDTFTAFCWVGNLNSLNFYNKSKALQKEANVLYSNIAVKKAYDHFILLCKLTKETNHD